MQYRECTYVSCLEEYKGLRKSGQIVHILHFLHILILDQPLPGWISVRLQAHFEKVLRMSRGHDQLYIKSLQRQLESAHKRLRELRRP